MTTYTVKEEGKNGKVEVLPDRIVRTVSKRIGRDDTQTIPLRAVTAIRHDRRTMGSDRVTLDAGTSSYEWKVARAEEMVAEVQGFLFENHA